MVLSTEVGSAHEFEATVGPQAAIQLVQCRAVVISVNRDSKSLALVEYEAD